MTDNSASASGSAPITASFQIVVGLIAGAIIADQIAIMRIFAIGTWTHFGSFVISVAMLAFGVSSAVMCIRTDFFQRHWRLIADISLFLFGPLVVICNTVAQTVGFNPIELVDDPGQKYQLMSLFLLYFVPFLPGALFLGLAFLYGKDSFPRIYFADLLGSGLCSLVFLLGLYVVPPEQILLIPLALWAGAALVWFAAAGSRLGLAATAIGGLAAAWICFALPQITVNEFKGVSYARKFPDSKRIYAGYGAFGYVEAYTSSYFHFAAGLSDNAALNLEQMPKDAFIGLYVDSEGPIGVMKKLPRSQRAYFEFLPTYLPYVIKPAPSVFVVQNGGGISTQVALTAGAPNVTVAEGNPQLVAALRDVPAITGLTGQPLDDPRITLIPFGGRLFIKGTDRKFDVIDLSLADATGLSAPGGFSVVESYNYTVETMAAYMEALAPGGVLAVTTWNKQDLPKAVPKLFTTMTKAAWARDGKAAARNFFVMHTYLSTVTVLYKKSGFTADDLKKLQTHVDDMSFVTLYRPGLTIDPALGSPVFKGFRATHFPDYGKAPPPKGAKGPALSWDNLYKAMLGYLMQGRFDRVAEEYVFDTRPLTNDRPYFTGFVKTGDVAHFLRNMGAVKDEWGYLLLWVTLGVATLLGMTILLLPVAAGWRTIFGPQKGKAGLLLYFLCLGAGYIIVEVGLIGKFLVALGSPTVSASVLITGMLMFSGFGALYSHRVLHRCREVMPGIFVAIAALLALGAFFYDAALAEIGQWSAYPFRIAVCLALLAPAAFLMGFPFPVAMAELARLHKERFFIWAWGINGTFSVIGAVAVPLLAVMFGQSVPILGAALLYLLAWPAFRSVLMPPPARAG